MNIDHNLKALDMDSILLDNKNRVMNMKITVITGSPHRKGTSALLADSFIKGAEESGHEVFRFDAAFKQIHPCLGCDQCGMGSAPCIQDDDMEVLNPALLSSDLVVLVTPLYYFGFSAQIKSVIDRFYAHSYELTGHKKVILMATSWDDQEITMNALRTHYLSLVTYMQWKDLGAIYATGCGTRTDIENSKYPELAYLKGKNL